MGCSDWTGVIRRTGGIRAMYWGSPNFLTTANWDIVLTQKNLDRVHYEAELGQATHWSGPDTGNHVKVSARLCEA
jgi:hypothetical protein